MARADEVAADDLEPISQFCDSNRVELLIARCRIEDIATTHALGAAGFALMDTLVYYQRDLTALATQALQPGLIESLGTGDAQQVVAIARECFTEYSGHYHADPRLDRVACREAYASWAQACCDHTDDGSFVLVAGDRENRTGFSCFRRSSESEGELLLGGVRAEARGRGLYTQLTLTGMNRLKAAGATRFLTSTHLGNWSAQAAWTAAGLHPYRAYHTFHRWFDGTAAASRTGTEDSTSSLTA